jgi:hypothetical protein
MRKLLVLLVLSAFAVPALPPVATNAHANVILVGKHKHKHHKHHHHKHKKTTNA